GSDKDLYFDIRHLRCMMYGSAGELDTLAARLDDGIATTLAKMPAQPEARQIVRPPGLLDDGIAAFLGPTLRGPLQPVSVTSWTGFTRVFGAPLPPFQSYLGYAVRGFFENGGREAWPARQRSDPGRLGGLRQSRGASDGAEQHRFVHQRAQRVRRGGASLVPCSWPRRRLLHPAERRRRRGAPANRPGLHWLLPENGAAGRPEH